MKVVRYTSDGSLLSPQRHFVRVGNLPLYLLVLQTLFALFHYSLLFCCSATRVSK